MCLYLACSTVAVGQNTTSVIYTLPATSVGSCFEIGAVFLAIALVFSTPGLALAGKHARALKSLSNDHSPIQTFSDNPYATLVVGTTSALSVFMYGQWLINWVGAYIAWRFNPTNFAPITDNE